MDDSVNLPSLISQVETALGDLMAYLVSTNASPHALAVVRSLQWTMVSLQAALGLRSGIEG
jgi:hypothetical protein